MFLSHDALRSVIGPEIDPFRGTIIITRSMELVSGGDSILSNGGFGLVDTGEKKLLVTCHHVWKDFQNQRAQNPQARLSVCLHGTSSPIVFDKHDPIDQDATLDIATFDMSPVLAACGEHKFYPLNQNPAPCVATGDKLVLLGDQGHLRSLTDEGLVFGVITYSVQISSVVGLRFRASISSAGLIYVQPPVRVPKLSPHGGISGSPCFLVREAQPSQLVGFVTDVFAIQETEHLIFTHASCLNPDGSINRMGN